MIDELIRSLHRMENHHHAHRGILTEILKEIRHMSTSPAGLAALTQAVTDLTSSVSAAVAKLSDLASQLSALNSEDPAVQNLAKQIEDQVSSLNSAVNPSTPTA